MSSHTNTARINTRLTDEYDFTSLPYLKLSSKTIKVAPYISQTKRTRNENENRARFKPLVKSMHARNM